MTHSRRMMTLARLMRLWNRRDWLEVAVLVGVIALLHLVGFGSLVMLIAPRHYQVGAQVFGIGLGVTAYTFGLRHAFDADHIAAIDNTTRKLTADGKKPKAVGFWFAIGHSLMVLLLAVLVIAGTKAAGVLLQRRWRRAVRDHGGRRRCRALGGGGRWPSGARGSRPG